MTRLLGLIESALARLEAADGADVPDRTVALLASKIACGDGLPEIS
jgi:hypothetical protein